MIQPITKYKESSDNERGAILFFMSAFIALLLLLVAGLANLLFQQAAQKRLELVTYSAADGIAARWLFLCGINSNNAWNGLCPKYNQAGGFTRFEAQADFITLLESSLATNGQFDLDDLNYSYELGVINTAVKPFVFIPVDLTSATTATFVNAVRVSADTKVDHGVRAYLASFIGRNESLAKHTAITKIVTTSDSVTSLAQFPRLIHPR